MIVLLAACAPPDLPRTNACDEVEWHEDRDGDGFAGEHVVRIACVGEAGEVTDASDCDDHDPAVFPGADELCNEADDDCDGELDEDPVEGNAHCPTDEDGDGYGDPARSELTCEAARRTTSCDDCDDADPEVNPGAYERCDDLDVDEDCDGVAELDFVGDAPEWFPDADGDGHAASESRDGIEQCNPIPGRADTRDDCDDTDPTRHPGAPELCDDEVDNDCDGRAGELCNIVLIDVATADARFAYDDGTGLFGEASAATGDLTGDGIADLAVGGPAPDVGWVFVFAGTTLGDVDEDDAAWFGYGDGDTTPQYVASPGDVDGDGLADLALASNVSGGPEGGAAWVFTGPLSGSAGLSEAWAIAEGTPCGRGIFPAGDLDGDGRADLLIGGNVEGDTHLFLWTGISAGSRDPGDSTRLLADGAFGEAALALDDDGDGLAELLVGGSTLYRFDAPFVSDFTVEDAAAALEGAYAWGTPGSLIDAGDLDGDGDDDALVGGSYPSAGAIYVLAGEDEPASGSIEDAATAVLTGSSPGAGLGRSMAAADFDGDGEIDILSVSDPNLDGAAAYVFLGPVTGNRSAPEADAVIVGFEDQPVGAMQLHSVPDVDSDAADELFVTSTQSTGWSGSEGAAWLFRGGEWVRP